MSLTLFIKKIMKVFFLSLWLELKLVSYSFTSQSAVTQSVLLVLSQHSHRTVSSYLVTRLTTLLLSYNRTSTNLIQFFTKQTLAWNKRRVKLGFPGNHQCRYDSFLRRISRSRYTLLINSLIHYFFKKN